MPVIREGTDKGPLCLAGRHRWRLIRSERPDLSEVLANDRILLKRFIICVRCREIVLRIRRRRDVAIGPEGIIMPYQWMPPDDADTAKYLRICSRAGTRVHGKRRDGSVGDPSPCEHHYHRHGRVMRYPGNVFGFVEKPCKDCACEGFVV